MAVLLLGCGGGSADGAKSAADVNDESDDTAWSSHEDDPQSGGESSSEPSGPDCTDETCFVCGDGLCPVGFYCDAGASGGPACSWLPECADVATCGCVEKVLGSSCSCDDSGGGPRVTCE